MTEPSDQTVSATVLSSSSFLPSTSANFLATSAALPAEDVRRIAQEVVSIMRDTPSYNPLTSTSATGVATSGKLNLCLLHFGHRPYNKFYGFTTGKHRPKCAAGSPEYVYLYQPTLVYMYVYLFYFSHTKLGHTIHLLSTLVWKLECLQCIHAPVKLKGVLILQNVHFPNCFSSSWHCHSWAAWSQLSVWAIQIQLGAEYIIRFNGI